MESVSQNILIVWHQKVSLNKAGFIANCLVLVGSKKQQIDCHLMYFAQEIMQCLGWCHVRTLQGETTWLDPFQKSRPFQVLEKGWFQLFFIFTPTWGNDPI